MRDSVEKGERRREGERLVLSRRNEIHYTNSQRENVPYIKYYSQSQPVKCHLNHTLDTRRCDELTQER